MPVPTTTPGGSADTPVAKTLLVTDLVDSAKLTEKLGDRRAAEIYKRHDRLARDLLPQYGGCEIAKTDGFMLIFERPIDAVRYALAYHAGLAALSKELGTNAEKDGIRLTARVGIHFGEVVLSENPPEDVKRRARPIEMEGLAVSIVARVMSPGMAGQTLMTSDAFNPARRAAVGEADFGANVRWLTHGRYRFQGVDEPMTICEVGLEGTAPLQPPPDSDKVWRVADWRPSRRAVMVAAAVISLIAGGLIIFKFLPRATPLPELRIDSMQVEHWRDSAYLGKIGGSTHTEPVRINDEIRVLVKLSRPAYCYLLAFTADGGSTVCLPATGSTDADFTPGLEHFYPIDWEKTAYFLRESEGTGLTAFVAMTSDEPHPSLATQLHQAGALPWARGSASAVWWSDGRKFTSHGRGEEPRHKNVPEAFKDVCEAIAGRTELAAVFGIAFPVYEAPELDESTDTRKGMP